MHRIQRLVVLLNRTETDFELMRFAEMIAEWGTLQSIGFVHVLPEASDRDATQGHESILTAVEHDVSRHFGSKYTETVKVSSAVLSGPMTDRILAHLAEQHADLVLLGEPGTGHARRALARRLAMKATCSVLLIPEQSPIGIRKVLVPIDFSRHAEDTLRVGVSLARAAGAVCQPLHVYFNEAVVTYEEYDQVLRGHEKSAYDKFVQGIDCRGVDMRPLFEESANVPHAICRVAEREGSDVIVMGTRGRSRSASILLGSVTDETMQQTRVPLLAVKHFGAQMTVLEALLDRRFRQGGRLHTD
jgi:nucleotide-binding universal stress UspA family protein